MTDVTAQTNIDIQARVFRAKPKPTWIPWAIWNLLPTRFTHKVENLGTVASSKDGTASFIR